MNRKILIALIMAVMGLTARGQEVGIKTNVLSDAFLNVNLGVEVGLAPQWTLNVGGELNDWTLSHGRRWKHWDLCPEARYWFCERFAGHFVGVHAIVGQYNAAVIVAPAVFSIGR